MLTRIVLTLIKTCLANPWGLMLYATIKDPSSYRFFGLQHVGRRLRNHPGFGVGRTLIFAHVAVPSPDFAASPESAEGRPYALPSQQDPGEATLDKVTPTAAGVTFTHQLLSGDPADELLSLAAQEQVELIVMGTHGHTALSKLLLGSVAEAVVQRATCPVITLRLPRGSLHS